VPPEVGLLCFPIMSRIGKVVRGIGCSLKMRLQLLEFWLDLSGTAKGLNTTASRDVRGLRQGHSVSLISAVRLLPRTMMHAQRSSTSVSPNSSYAVSSKGI
jgi:hypothetical protein